jgi:phosphinothricin acetyltransferase
MPPRPTVRLATPADFDAVTAIYADAVAHGTASFETDPPCRGEMLRRHDVLTAAGFPWIVAEADGVLLGYGYFGPYRPRPAYRFTVENSIYVAPAAKRLGVGRLILEELVARAEAAGYRRMIAVIGDSANAASIGLHAALGFLPAGVLPSVGWKHGRWLDSVFMQRPLGPGDTAPPDEPR